ncbi:hypothetical protein RBU49_06745 [Clostridium sp. MB40-C1]|uniref:hypothetical protein n=1 Tax=Clostridium sp. MB40-C1 TaxID=3070996 RepID=UPI0027E089A8|nr:hypothetical protein [Clostridium sp. MB40-C1]WMJ81940.1 hypothetical protein RBU49_06745 [Clostridium sp. MB40-C1]
MKKLLIGYITALINTYSKRVSPKGNIIENKCNAIFTNDLMDLLDFVEDIKEDSQPVLNNVETADLKEYVKVLYSSCEANNETIRQQYERIVKLKDENDSLKSKLGIEGMEE